MELLVQRSRGEENDGVDLGGLKGQQPEELRFGAKEGHAANTEKNEDRCSHDTRYPTRLIRRKKYLLFIPRKNNTGISENTKCK